MILLNKKKGAGMTIEEKQKAIDALKISAPVMAVTQEEFHDYIRTLNTVVDLLEQQPCEDAISKKGSTSLANYDLNMGQVVDGVHALPPVTPQPKVGHWIENAPEYQNIDPPYICSECGNLHLRKTNYCDQCGCRMVEQQESEE